SERRATARRICSASYRSGRTAGRGCHSMTVSEIASLTASFDGYLLGHEGPFLYQLAFSCAVPGAIVEIGSYCGRSTTWLAAGSADGPGATVYAVDHHRGSEEHRASDPEHSTLDRFLCNIHRAGVDHLVQPVVQDSAGAAAEWHKPIALLFIDGAHDYA